MDGGPSLFDVAYLAERNNQHFKDFEKVVPDLKVFFFKILLDWVAVLDFCSIFLVHGLMDTCTLGT